MDHNRKVHGGTNRGATGYVYTQNKNINNDIVHCILVTPKLVVIVCYRMMVTNHPCNERTSPKWSFIHVTINSTLLLTQIDRNISVEPTPRF